MSGSAEQPFYAAMNGETRAGIQAALGDGAESAFERGRGLELEEGLELATG